MSKIVYNKLVRDKIPEIISAQGQKALTSILDQSNYNLALKEKVLEEGQELLAAQSIEEIENELADLLELIYSIAANQQISLDQLEQTRLKKQSERGGFQKQIFLHSVEQ